MLDEGDLGDGAGLLSLLEDALRELAEEDGRGARPEHLVGDGGRLPPRRGLSGRWRCRWGGR